MNDYKLQLNKLDFNVYIFVYILIQGSKREPRFFVLKLDSLIHCENENL